MGTFTFIWPHEAEEVYVTGTFDNWSKSEQLEKVGSHFEKTVTLPETSENIFYKFVVDGNWTTDHTAPQAKDSEGNVNNLLKHEDIIKHISPAAATMTTVAPESSTAALAKDVPLEKQPELETPTVLNTEAPESTTSELVKAVPLDVVAVEEEKKEVVPVKEVKEETSPAQHKQEDSTEASGLPGTFPVTPAAELDNKQFGVNPLPATEGALNPIKLAPDTQIPESIIGTNTIHSNVTLDKESYEKSDRIPGVETELPPVSRNMIPESSLPIIGGDLGDIGAPGNVGLLNSVAPQSSTVGLAAEMPLLPKVPEVVRQSQEKADVAPAASGRTEPVLEKAQVEDELLAKIPEAPSTSEGTAGKGTEKSETDRTTAERVVEGVVDGAIAAGETLLGAAIVAGSAAYSAGQKLVEKGQPVAEQSVSTGAAATVNAKDVVVERSQTAAQQASESAVAAKDTVVVGSQNAAAQTAEMATAAKDSIVQGSQSAAQQATEAVTAAKDSIVSTANATGQTATDTVKQVLPTSLLGTGAPSEVQVPEISPLVPAEVKESIDESGQGPEAAAYTSAVLQKNVVEAELMKEVQHKSDEHGEVSDEVPAEVKESIEESGYSPEAAASSSAVEHKHEVEAELLQSVQKVKSTDEQPEESSPDVSKAAVPIAEPVPPTAVEAVNQPTLKVQALQSGELTPGPSTTVDPLASAPPQDAATTAESEKVEMQQRSVEPIAHGEPVRESAVEAVNQPTPSTEAVGNEQPSTFEAAPTTAQPSEVNGAHSSLAAPAQESSLASQPATTQPAAETQTPAPVQTPTKPAAPASEKTTTPGSSKAATGSDSNSTTEKKKKNRLSSFFSKLKGKGHHDK